MGQDSRLRQLAVANGVEVPRRGENHYYLLNIESLCEKVNL
jgi:hypothetical protein